MPTPSLTSSTEAHSLNRRHIAFTIIMVIIVMIASELTAGFIYRRIDLPDSYHAARNPNFRRAWDAYTQPPSTLTNDRRIIIISNSQGFLREDTNASHTYAAQLETMLNAQSPDERYHVLNWSIPGGNAAEFVLLAARASVHQPEAIILVTYGEDFELEQRPISFYISDAYRLGYLPDVRQHLPAAFIAQHEIDDPLEWLDSNTALGRLKNMIEFPRDDRWTWHTAFRPDLPEQLNLPGNRWTARGQDMMQFFHETLSSSAPQARLMVVQMPLNEIAFNPDGWTQLQEFVPGVEALFNGITEVSVHDATTLIAPERYYSATHFDPDGHRQFAAWLAPRVIDILEAAAR